MGDDVSRSHYEGILIPDPRIKADSYWAAESNAVESSPMPGPIEADDGVTTKLVLDACGTLVAGDDLYVRVQRAGVPGTGVLGIAWNDSVGANWFGWDRPATVSGYEFVLDGTGTTLYSDPDIAASDGHESGSNLVMVAGFSDASLTGWAARVRAGDGGAWGATSIIYFQTTTTGETHARILRLPSGRLLVFAFVYFDPQGRYDVGLWVSDDGGANWTLASEGVLEATLSSATVPTRLRVAYNPVDGSILLLIGDSAGIKQYASASGGTYFESVATPAGLGDEWDIAWIASSWVFSFWDTPTVKFRRWANAFTSLDNSTGITPPSNINGSTCTALVAAADGMLYCYGDVGEAGWGMSRDGGATWEVGPGGGTQWMDDALSDYLRWSGTYFEGRCLIAVGDTPADPGSSFLLHMGGYTTVTMPPQYTGHHVGRQAWFSRCWCAAMGLNWTTAHTGAPTIAFDATKGSLSVAPGVGEQAMFYLTRAAGTYNEVVVRHVFERVSNIARIRIRSVTTAGGGDYTEVEVSYSGAGLTLYDQVGAAIVAGPVAAPGAKVEVLVAVKGRSVVAYYREWTADGPKRGTGLGSSATLTLNGAGGVPDRVAFIVEASSDFDWYETFWLWDGDTVSGAFTLVGDSLADGFTNPDDLHGRPVPAPGDLAYISDGLSIFGRDGPGMAEETFTLDVRHPHPIEHCIPDVRPSPRDYCEIAAGIGKTIAWDLTLETGSTTDTHLGQDTILVYMHGQVQEFTLQGYDQGAVSWTDIATFDRSETVAYERVGDAVFPRSSAGASGTSSYWARDELKGGYFVFAGGLDPRTVLRNTEGNWDDGSIDEKRPVLYLDPDEVDGTEDTGPSTGGKLIPPKSLHIAHLAGANEYRGYRLKLHPTGGTSNPPGGTFRIYVAAMGTFVPFGKRTDREYSHVTEPLVEVTELPDASDRTRVRGPARRRVIVNLADGLDITTTRGASDPDYIAGTTSGGAEPIGHARDLPLLLDGLISELDGPHRPVVLCMRIPAGTPNSGNLLHRPRYVYSRLVSVSRFDVVVGDPANSEFVRMQGLEFVELT